MRTLDRPNCGTMPYSDRKGISYDTSREVGVPADVLARAGLGRRPG
jgi:hypothetical protein